MSNGNGWAPGAVRPLTKQELLVLDCVANGMTNQEIAEVLDLSKNTIKVHKFNAYKKCGFVGLGKAAAAAAVRKMVIEHAYLFDA